MRPGLLASAIDDFGSMTPADLGGCVLWLSDDSRLVTLAQPSVANPKDLSQSGTWARTGLTSVTHGQSDPDGGTSGDLVTEDSSTGAHGITQSMGSVVTGIPIRARFRVKAGTSGSRGVVLNPSGGNAYINPATGAVTSQTGLTSVVVSAQSDGWWLVDLVVTSCAGATMLIGLSSSPGVASYTGDGTSNARAYFVEAEQNGARYVYDRSPVATQAAPYVEQATRASQPVWSPSDSDFLGHPSLKFDGSDDVLATPANLVLGAHTMIWAGRLIGSSSDAGLCGTGTSGYAFTHHNANTLYYYSGPAQFCQFAQGQNETCVLGGRWTGDTTANGQQVWKNGVLQAQRTHSGAALTPGTFKVGRITTTTGSKLSQIVLYNRALSDDEFLRVQRAFGRRIGVAIP